MFHFRCILLLSVFFCISCKHNKKNTDEFKIVTEDQLYSIPDAPRWVLDLENIFTAEEIDTLNQLCHSLYERTQQMVMIHTVNDFGSFHTLNQYASVIDRAWGDASQKYIIFIISIASQEIRIIYGTETEQQIPEHFTNKLLDQTIFPYFRHNQYYKGIKQSLFDYASILTS